MNQLPNRYNIFHYYYFDVVGTFASYSGYAISV